MHRNLRSRMNGTSVVAGVAALLCAGAADAGLTTESIFLSDLSSDDTPASILDAEFEFAVDDMLGTMTLTVTNNTLGDGDFNMNELYFNLPGSVSDFMSTTLPTDWVLSTLDMVNGFGTFDIGLTTPGGEADPALINPGETVAYMFSFTGVATASDFTSALSMPPPDDYIPSVAAAKFVNGFEDDSAFGAAVPAPGVLALMGIAGIVGTRRRRRPA